MPAVARESASSSAVGVRCRPFGSEDDNGQLMWVAGAMVARTADSMYFVCVDLLKHGPIQPDTVEKLAGMGVFDKYEAGHSPRKPSSKPSAKLCAAKLNEFDEIRHLAHSGDSQWTASPWHHLSRQHATNMQSLRERTEAIATHVAKFGASPTATSSPAQQVHQPLEEPDAYSLDLEDSEAYSMDEHSMDEHSMDEVDELQTNLRDMDLNHEQVWATLIQGSRVL